MNADEMKVTTTYLTPHFYAEITLGEWKTTGMGCEEDEAIASALNMMYKFVGNNDHAQNRANIARIDTAWTRWYCNHAMERELSK